jgi:hypothetical protein
MKIQQKERIEKINEMYKKHKIELLKKYIELTSPSQEIPFFIKQQLTLLHNKQVDILTKLESVENELKELKEGLEKYLNNYLDPCIVKIY